MWAIAGALLGLVVLASVVGFHVGPHAHVAAGGIGLVAAVWLLAMAAAGYTEPALWVLLGADLVVSGGVAVLARNGIRDARTPRPVPTLEGAEGVAVGDLTPEGIVRVGGESWSAVCVNGSAPAGARVQVLHARGVRLDVWAEEQLERPGGPS